VRLTAIDRDLIRLHRSNPVSQLLAEIPGVGPISALSFALTVGVSQFKSGRHLAAWLGLTPKQKSTTGKRRLGGISRQGNERLGQLLVLGATAVVRTVKPSSRHASAWLLALLQRRPRKLAAVALANKMARVVWAMFRHPRHVVWLVMGRRWRAKHRWHPVYGREIQRTGGVGDECQRASRETVHAVYDSDATVR
jgi:transposase